MEAKDWNDFSIEKQVFKAELHVDKKCADNCQVFPFYTTTDLGIYFRSWYERKKLDKLSPIKLKLHGKNNITLNYLRAKDSRDFEKFLSNIPFHKISVLHAMRNTNKLTKLSHYSKIYPKLAVKNILSFRLFNYSITNKEFRHLVNWWSEAKEVLMYGCQVDLNNWTFSDKYDFKTTWISFNWTDTEWESIGKKILRSFEDFLKAISLSSLRKSLDWIQLGTCNISRDSAIDLLEKYNLNKLKITGRKLEIHAYYEISLSKR